MPLVHTSGYIFRLRACMRRTVSSLYYFQSSGQHSEMCMLSCKLVCLPKIFSDPSISAATTTELPCFPLL